MRSKVIFLLLFLFSFVIAHDSVMVAIDNPSVQTIDICSDDIHAEHEASVSSEWGQLHAMFHFVALTSDIPLLTVNTISKRCVASMPALHPSPLKETSYKPPIV